MSGPFLSPVSLSALRYEQEVFNSRLKRGEVYKPEQIRSTHQVYCGCGHPRCAFVAMNRQQTEAERQEHIAWMDAQPARQPTAEELAEEAAASKRWKAKLARMRNDPVV